MKLKPIKKNIPLSQKAYEIIKDAIINNEIKPGSLLAEEPLSRELSISRTPIRSALRQLIYEGLAEFDSTNHVIVSSITKEDILNINVIRKNLETLCIELLKLPLENNDLETLKNIINKQEEVLNSDNPKYIDYISLDYDFHIFLATLTNNNYLIEMITKLNQITNRFLILSETLNTDSYIALKEHKEIINFLTNNRKEFAIISMKNHIENVTNRLTFI